jgi:hypothetical protein
MVWDTTGKERAIWEQAGLTCCLLVAAKRSVFERLVGEPLGRVA